MARRLRLELFLLYSLAAFSCEDDNAADAGVQAGRGDREDTGSGPSGGTSGGGVGGTSGGGRGGTGSECTPDRVGPTPPTAECHGGVITWMGLCTPRYEQVECYVANDEECLPASTPELARRVADYIRSAGFGPEFVIDSADERELPESCAALLQCCVHLDKDWDQKSCVDAVDGTTADDADIVCRKRGGTSRPADGCLVNPSDSDAGAHAPAKLCCYRTCGYFRQT